MLVNEFRYEFYTAFPVSNLVRTTLIGGNVSSHSVGISSDFTPLGSIRKLEVLCSVDLYTGERSQKPVLIELSCIAVQINKNPRRTDYRSIDTKPC